MNLAQIDRFSSFKTTFLKRTDKNSSKKAKKMFYTYAAHGENTHGNPRISAHHTTL